MCIKFYLESRPKTTEFWLITLCCVFCSDWRLVTDGQQAFFSKARIIDAAWMVFVLDNLIRQSKMALYGFYNLIIALCRFWFSSMRIAKLSLTGFRR